MTFYTQQPLVDSINIKVSEEYLSEVAELDECYVLKTDLAADTVSMETIQKNLCENNIIKMKV